MGDKTKFKFIVEVSGRHESFNKKIEKRISNQIKGYVKDLNKELKRIPFYIKENGVMIERLTSPVKIKITKED